MPQRTSPYILFTILLSTSLLGAVPRRTNIDSIRIHATTISENAKLPLSLVTKRKSGIRATIHIPGKLTRAVVLFNGEKLYLIQELTEEGSIKEIEGDDAAANLFEMLAINPDFHFQKEALSYTTAILDDYKIELLREEIITQDGIIKQPTMAKLYARGNTELKLLKTIQYVEFFPLKDYPCNQPKKITYTDHRDNSIGEIIIDKVSYNSGIGDFIFQLPE